VARKLKTYQTSQGFFDLAIAAPSMKAALEAWGANSNLFHQGFASEADDPKVIAAAMTKPGVVLRRPVGTQEPFSEHAHLPTSLVKTGRDAEPYKPSKRSKKSSSGKVDDKTARKTALAYAREERRRKSERRKEEAALAKRREQRERVTAKARAEFDAAEREHALKIAGLDKERALIDKRSQAEEDRWDTQRKRLKEALRKASE
jgi:colicin import membrane protein